MKSYHWIHHRPSVTHSRRQRRSISGDDAMSDPSNEGSPATLSRRAAIAAVTAMPLSLQLPASPATANAAVAELVKVAEEKNAAFVRGDMERWSKLARI